MKNDIKLLTYSVSLIFSKDIENLLSSIRHKIAKLTNNTYSDNLNIPPHITLGMFRAYNGKNDKINFLENLKPFISYIHRENNISLTLDKFEIFRNKDIFGKFKNCDVVLLKELNKLLHGCAQDKYKPCCNNLYIEKNFYPHVSIITGLSNKELNIGLEAIDIYKNLICPIDKLIIAERQPYNVFYEEKL